jgi:alpha-mannosidase
VPVDLSSAYNATAIYSDGVSEFAPTASADGEGFAYSKETLGSSQLWDGVLFNLGPANAPDVVTGKTVTLPERRFDSVELLATGVEGGQESQVFTITYADGTSSSITQSLSDWYESERFTRASRRLWIVPYRLDRRWLQGSIARSISTAIPFKLDRSKSPCAASLCRATNMCWSSP